MSRKGKQPLRPTLVQTLLGLIETEPEFSSIDRDSVVSAANEYYEKEQGKFGKFLVSRKTITQSQLTIALAMQADLAGEHDKFIEHMRKAFEDLRCHMAMAVNEADVIAEALEKVMAYDD